MSLLSPADEIDIEQDVVIATLDSALASRGDAKKFAERAGVSPVCVSYIRGERGNIPRVETAQRIARALPLSAQERNAWLNRVKRIWELRRHQHERVRQSVRDRALEEQIGEIRQAHGAATFAVDPKIARARYRQVESAAGDLIRLVNPNEDPIHYIELCLLNHDALCVVNRNRDALWYAERASRISGNIDDPRRYHVTREQFDEFRVNALRSEAVSLHNLKLYRQAFEKCREAEESDALKRNANFWMPHLYRDAINAMEGIPRFSIRRAQKFAERVQDICQERADELDPFLFFLISQSLARAYIKHSNLKAAYRVLVPQLDRMSQIKFLGPLHQVIFWRTFARLCIADGNAGDDFQYLAREGLRIAKEAGLAHQLAEMRTEFGKHVDETTDPENLQGTPLALT